MKFKVTTSGSFYTKDEAEKLKSLGFTFGVNEYDEMRRPYLTGDYDEVEISTLEELISFSNYWGDIIVSDGKIEIYDDYRE